MGPRTRLDPVVKLQEHHETRTLTELADANRRAHAAATALRAAEQAAGQDRRKSGANAADWQLAESAHTRALAEVSSAKRSVDTATVAASSSRARYVSAHAKTEALRRVQDLRRQDALRVVETGERRESDELFLTRKGPGRAA